MVDLQQLDLQLQDLEVRLNGIQFQLFRLANAMEYRNMKKYGYKPEYEPKRQREL